jgi:phosphatidylglycerophosphate synthase
MSKLTAQDKFFDLSDYGRFPATVFANLLKHTRITPIHVTLMFGLSGLIAVYCILTGHYWLAGGFIILKSILDAADGELSRVKNTPSYTGRYLDSVFDIILNAAFLMAISYVANTPYLYTIIAFLCIQLQGTLYNYYYVILRHKATGGDVTSRIIESESPTAFPTENQKAVDILFALFSFFYSHFDNIIYHLDPDAVHVKTIPRWFMTCVSMYGLGFQLLIIAVLLPLNLIAVIVPFFIFYSCFMVILIGIRRNLLTI